MSEVKPLVIRSCPLCRVAMVRSESPGTARPVAARSSMLRQGRSRNGAEQPRETAAPARLAAALRA